MCLLLSYSRLSSPSVHACCCDWAKWRWKWWQSQTMTLKPFIDSCRWRALCRYAVNGLIVSVREACALLATYKNSTKCHYAVCKCSGWSYERCPTTLIITGYHQLESSSDESPEYAWAVHLFVSGALMYITYAFTLNIKWPFLCCFEIMVWCMIYSKDNILCSDTSTYNQTLWFIFNMLNFSLHMCFQKLNIKRWKLR